MLKKTRIGMLVAGALFAAQAGAELGPSHQIIWLDGSTPETTQLVVFEPETSFSIIPVEISVVESDAGWSGSEQLTAFDPDSMSYSIYPLYPEVATLDPSLLIMEEGETLPEQLTVFDPSGLSYSYEFAPVEVAVLEPIDVVVMSEDVSMEPVALIDEDADLRPTYTAHFVSAPEYTGILEESMS